MVFMGKPIYDTEYLVTLLQSSKYLFCPFCVTLGEHEINTILKKERRVSEKEVEKGHQESWVTKELNLNGENRRGKKQHRSRKRSWLITSGPLEMLLIIRNNSASGVLGIHTELLQPNV